MRRKEINNNSSKKGEDCLTKVLLQNNITRYITNTATQHEHVFARAHECIENKTNKHKHYHNLSSSCVRESPRGGKPVFIVSDFRMRCIYGNLFESCSGNIRAKLQSTHMNWTSKFTKMREKTISGVAFVSKTNSEKCREKIHFALQDLKYHPSKSIVHFSRFASSKSRKIEIRHFKLTNFPKLHLRKCNRFREIIFWIRVWNTICILKSALRESCKVEWFFSRHFSEFLLSQMQLLKLFFFSFSSILTFNWRVCCSFFWWETYENWRYFHRSFPSNPLKSDWKWRIHQNRRQFCVRETMRAGIWMKR